MPFTKVYSSDYLTELEPYYVVKVDGIPLSQQDNLNIQYVQITYEDNKRTLLQFEYWDKDKDKLDNPIFKLGQRIDIDAGYRSNYESFGPFDVDLADEKITTRRFLVKASTGGTLNKTVRRRVFSSGAVLDVIERISNEHGYTLNIEGDPLIDLALTEDNVLVQSGETDMQFIQRVANSFGLLIRTEGNQVILADEFGSNLDVVQLTYDRADATIDDIRVKFSKPQIIKPPTPTDIRCVGKGDNPLVQEAEDGQKFFVDVLQLTQFGEQYIEEREDGESSDIESSSTERTLRSFAPKIGQKEGGVAIPCGSDTAGTHPDSAIDPSVGADKLAWVQSNAFVEDTLANAFRRETNEEVSDASDSPVSLVDESSNVVRSLFSGDAGLLTLVNSDGVVDADDEGSTAEEVTDEVLGSGVENTNDSGKPDPSLDAANIKPEGLPLQGKRKLKQGRVLEVSIKLKFGSILFKPKTKVLLKDLGKRISGEYRVRKVVHKWGTSGYKTNLDLIGGFEPPKKPVPPIEEDEETSDAEDEETTETSETQIPEDWLQINQFGVTRVETIFKDGPVKAILSKNKQSPVE